MVNLDSIFHGSENTVRFVVPGDMATFEEGQALNDMGLTSRHGRLLKLSSWIDLDNITSIGCVGAVLTYLQRKRASEYLQDDADAELAYRVEVVEMFSLVGTM